MRSIETCSVPNKRKIEKQEEQEEKRLEKQTIKQVGVETILKRKSVLKWCRLNRSTIQ